MTHSVYDREYREADYAAILKGPQPLVDWDKYLRNRAAIVTGHFHKVEQSFLTDGCYGNFLCAQLKIYRDSAYQDGLAHLKTVKIPEDSSFALWGEYYFVLGYAYLCIDE